jgi:S1-C subfamily serine protease
MCEIMTTSAFVCSDVANLMVLSKPEVVYLGESTLPGDVIYAVSGKFVDTIESLRSALDDLKIADAIVLQIERLGILHYVVLETDK